MTAKKLKFAIVLLLLITFICSTLQLSVMAASTNDFIENVEVTEQEYSMELSEFDEPIEEDSPEFDDFEVYAPEIDTDFENNELREFSEESEPEYSMDISGQDGRIVATAASTIYLWNRYKIVTTTIYTLGTWSDYTQWTGTNRTASGRVNIEFNASQGIVYSGNTLNLSSSNPGTVFSGTATSGTRTEINSSGQMRTRRITATSQTIRSRGEFDREVSSTSRIAFPDNGTSGSYWYVYRGAVTTPSAPTSVTVTAGNRQATISWQPPSGNGGSAITGYRVSRDGNSWTLVSSGMRSHTFTGLTNGTALNLRVRAVNIAGDGTISIAPSVTPRTVPGIPASITATAGNGQATINWQPPTSNGGSAITRYEVSRDGTNWTGLATTARSHTFTGLTNGTSITLRVRAVNVAGSGSTASAAVTPRTVPGIPTGVTGTSGNQRATINWQPPTNNGGSAITGYEVSSDGVNWTRVGATVRSRAFTGLTNGISVVLRVRAVNVAGNGSTISVVVTPSTAPGAPTSVTGSAGNQTATINWQPPASNGGSAINGYEVSRDNVNWTRVGSNVRSHTFNSLANGTSVTLRVRAVNVAGNGSAVTVSVTPRTVPGIPASVAGAAGSERATISWQPPASNGGSAVTGYDVSSDGVNWTRVGATTRSRTFTNLTNGISVTLRVRAVNAAGNGSTATVTVMPGAVPGVPTSVTVTPGSERATISWQPPASNGGLAIIGYDVSRDNVNWTRVGATVRNHTFTGLVNGTSVTLRVRAINAVGNGSAATAAVTPRTIPDIPANVTIAPGNERVTLSWQPPSSNGGSAITGYELSHDGINWVGVGSGVRSRTFTDLTNGTSVTLRVRAVNAAGNGPAVSATATPRTVPGAPIVVTAIAGNGQATINWQPPVSNGGSTITGYQVSRDGSNWTNVASTVRNHTFTDLTNGTSVTLRVRAVNIAGNGATANAPSVTPRTVPGVPTSVTATAGNGQATINWQPPSSNGGSAITGYDVSRDGINWTRVGSTARSHTFTGLTNGTSVTLRVRAVNIAGNGAAVTAPAPTLTVLPSALSFLSSASNANINVTSNTTWSVASNQSWLTITNITPTNQNGNGSFRVNVTANTENDRRTGTITVTGGGVTHRIEVTQDISIVTMNYTVRVNSNVIVADANGIMDDVAPGFMDTFRIRLTRQSSSTLTTLNQRTGCTLPSHLRCSHPIDSRGQPVHESQRVVDETGQPIFHCGVFSRCEVQHHRSGGHFLSVNPSTGTTKVFKFVDYLLCSYRGASLPIENQHITVNGLADKVLGDNIIVSTRSDNVLRTTAHEISHLYGARDGVCSSDLTQQCVMRSGAAVYDEWCTICAPDIRRNRNRSL